MTKEYKKITSKNETRYVLENTSAGSSTTSASVAANGQTPTKGLGAIRRRLGELKDKITVKGTGTGGQRNVVAQDIIRQGGQTGAGAHRRRDKAAKSGSGKGKKDFKKFHGDLGEAGRPEGDTGNTLYLKFNKRRDFWTINAGYALRAGDLRHQTYVDRAEKLIVTERDLDRYIRELKANDEFNEVDKIRVVVDPDARYPEEITNFLNRVENNDYSDNKITVSTIPYEEHDEHERKGRLKSNRPSFQMGGKTAEKTKMAYFKVTDPVMKRAMQEAGMRMEGDAFVLPVAKYDAFLKTVSEKTRKDPSTFIQRVNKDLEERTMFGDRQDGGSAPWREIENIYGKGTSFEEEREHPDHEISMAKSELLDMVRDAIELLGLVKQHTEEEGLEAWQQSKITKAADYVHSVVRSLSADKGSEQFTESSKKKLGPKVRSYQVERPDGSKATYYEVLDRHGHRIPGQGTRGFDDKERANQHLRQHLEKNVHEGLVYYDDEIKQKPSGPRSMTTPGVIHQSFDETLKFLKDKYPYHKVYSLKEKDNPFKLYFDPLHGLRSAENISDVDQALNQLDLNYNPKLSGKGKNGSPMPVDWYTLESNINNISLLFKKTPDEESDQLYVLAKTDGILNSTIQVIKNAKIVPTTTDNDSQEINRIKNQLSKITKKGLTVGTKFKHAGSTYTVMGYSITGKILAQDDNGVQKYISPKLLSNVDVLQKSQTDIANKLREELKKKYETPEGWQGAVVGGVAGGVITKNAHGAITGAELGSAVQDMFSKDSDKDEKTDEGQKKGLYYNVNQRKKKGISRSKNHPKAPTDQAWRDAAKTAKTESVSQDQNVSEIIGKVARGLGMVAGIGPGVKAAFRRGRDDSIEKISGVPVNPERYRRYYPEPKPKPRPGWHHEYYRMTGTWPGEEDEPIRTSTQRSEPPRKKKPINPTYAKAYYDLTGKWPDEMDESKTDKPVAELSNKTVSNYVSKVANAQADKLGGIEPDMYGKIEKTFGDRGKQRKAGVDRALNRLFGTPKPGDEREPNVSEISNKESDFDPKDIYMKKEPVGLDTLKNEPANTQIKDPLHKQRVKEFFNSLNPKEQQIVYMFFWKDMTPKQVSQATGISQDRLKTFLRKMRRQFSDQFQITDPDRDFDTGMAHLPYNNYEKNKGPKFDTTNLDVNILSKKKVNKSSIDEVTGDPKFDMMMSKIVGGANVQMLAHQFAEKIKNFPKYLDNDDKEYFDDNNEDPIMNGRFPNGYWMGHDGWHHTEVLNDWKSMGFKKWATRMGDSGGIWDEIDGTDMYHNYWNDYFEGNSVANKIQDLPDALYYPVMKEVWKEIFGQYPTDTQTEGVAGAQKCWPGHRKVGTQPGTGKNTGKRVNKCKKIKKKVKEDTYIDNLNNKLEQIVKR